MTRKLKFITLYSNYISTFTTQIISIDKNNLEFELDKTELSNSQVKSETVVLVQNLTNNFVGVRVLTNF